MNLLFEWDDRKADGNVSKHAVSFVEAQTVFLDPLLAIVRDPDHSVGENRYIGVGLSAQDRLLVVPYRTRVNYTYHFRSKSDSTVAAAV